MSSVDVGNNLSMGGNVVLPANDGIEAGDDPTLQGTNHATRTTNSLLLQPNCGNIGIGKPGGPAAKLHICGEVASVCTYDSIRLPATHCPGAEPPCVSSIGA